MESECNSEINFRLGWPNPNLLPVNDLQIASQVAFSRTEASTRDSLLEYGPDDGYLPLRRKIASWLTAFYLPQEPVSVDRICITGGASANLSCILQTFTDPAVTEYIWMTSPAYFCACRVFDDAGFAGKLRSVPEDHEGIDIEFLASSLERLNHKDETHPRQATKTSRAWSKTYRHIIYTVPTFANPSGRIMSLPRREALVALARKHDALIISDDVYDMLQWYSTPSSHSVLPKTACQPRLVDIDAFLDGGPQDAFGNCVSNGSFSKILGPGVRTGWAEATPNFCWGLSQTGSTRSGGCASQLAAAIITHMIDESLPRHISTVLQPIYSRRYYTIMNAISMYLLPLGVSTPQSGKHGIVGGYYIWLQFPEPICASQVAEMAAKHQNLLIHPGSVFAVEGDLSAEYNASTLYGARICFVWVEEDYLVQGVQRLAAVIKSLQISLE